jgi:hypothetical protein
LLNVVVEIMSRDSVVGIATAYAVEGRGIKIQVSVGSRIFTSSYRPDLLLFNGYLGLFPRVKAAGAPPTSAEVKKM